MNASKEQSHPERNQFKSFVFAATSKTAWN